MDSKLNLIENTILVVRGAPQRNRNAAGPHVRNASAPTDYRISRRDDRYPYSVHGKTDGKWDLQFTSGSLEHAHSLLSSRNVKADDVPVRDGGSFSDKTGKYSGPLGQHPDVAASILAESKKNESLTNFSDTAKRYGFSATDRADTFSYTHAHKNEYGPVTAEFKVDKDPSNGTYGARVSSSFTTAFGPNSVGSDFGRWKTAEEAFEHVRGVISRVPKGA